MKESQAIFMFNNQKENVDNEKQKYEKTKGRKCGKIRFLISHFHKEFVYGILLGLVTSLSLQVSYRQFFLTFMVKDDHDDAELKTSKVLAVFIALFMIICQLILIVFNLNRLRKNNYLIGHGIFGLTWLGMGISYYFGSYIFPKIAGFIFYGALGMSYYSTYFTMIAEVCGADLVFSSLLAFMLCNSAICFVAPYIITSTENNARWSVGAAVISLSATIFCYFYMIETQGLEKKDIYDLQRKNKTREQILEERKNELNKIVEEVVIKSLREIQIKSLREIQNKSLKEMEIKITEKENN